MNPKQMRRLMQQAAEMQARMAEAQQQMMERRFEGSAGGGAVVATVKGSGELVSVVFDPAVLDPDDPELVGDLVVAAVNQALRTAQEAAAGEIGDVTGGLDLGGLDLGGLLGP